MVGGMGLLASLLRREGTGERPPFGHRQPSAVSRPAARAALPGTTCSTRWRWDRSRPAWFWPVSIRPPGCDFSRRPSRPTAGALLDLLLAQHDEPKVPVLALVDRRLAADDTDGWLYEDMPEDATPGVSPWRPSTTKPARRLGAPSAELCLERRRPSIEAVQGADQWPGLAAAHVW